MVRAQAFRRLPLKSMLEGSSVLFIAMLVVNVLNYGYALVLGRLFGPEHYGAYASFISLLLLVSLLPLTLQHINARYTAAGENVSSYVNRLSLRYGIGFGLLLIVFARPFGQLVDLPAAWLVGLGVVFPAYALMGSLRGEAQGEQSFIPLGFNLVLEHLLKIVLTPLALLLVPLSGGAVLATLAALPLGLVQVWRFFKRKTVEIIDKPAVKRYALPIFLNLAAQAVIINSDLLMANALLDSETSGLYASVAIMGRVVFYGSWAVAAAFFPMIAARQAEGKSHDDLLYVALGSVAFICLGITGFCALFPEFVMTMLFGNAYLAAAPYLALYALMTTFFALANVIASHYLALGNHKPAYFVLSAAIIQIALILVMHEGISNIISAQMISKGGLLLVLVVSVFLGFFKEKNRVL